MKRRDPAAAALSVWTALVLLFLFFPLVAIVLGAFLYSEPVQPSFLLGGAVVLLGVYIGAIYRPKAAAEEPAPEPAPAEG